MARRGSWLLMGFEGAAQVLGMVVSCKSDPLQTPPVTTPPLMTAPAEAAPLHAQPRSEVTSPSPAPSSAAPVPCSWHAGELYGTHGSPLPVTSDL